MLLMPTSCGPGPPADAHAVDLSPTRQQRTRSRLRELAKTHSPTGLATTGIPKGLLMLLMLFAIVAQTPQGQVAAEKSKHCEYLPPFMFIYIYVYIQVLAKDRSFAQLLPLFCVHLNFGKQFVPFLSAQLLRQAANNFVGKNKSLLPFILRVANSILTLII